MTENEFMLADRIAKIQSINRQFDLENNAYLSFSGGKDSTVLHYLLDEAIPGNKIPRVFINTGIEYKDIYIYAKQMSETDERFVIFSPGVNIIQMLQEEGYPFKSKEHSQKVLEYRRGVRSKRHMQYFGFEESNYSKCPKQLLYQIENNDLKISHKCCYRLKKQPIMKWMKENKKSVTITGMRMQEGGNRKRLTCIITDKDNNLKKFHPLAVVNADFENWFIETRNIKLCKLYYPPFNFTRTGCKGCPFSLTLDKDLFVMRTLLPAEAKQCEIIWKPVYDEYRRLHYRLSPKNMLDL